MSGSLAGSISCMLAKKLHWVQAEDTYIASGFADVICEYMSGMQKSAVNKPLQKDICP